jgi:hypothetical protein
MAQTANRGRFPLLLLVVLAAGCGGGGGGGGAPPGGPLPPDTIPTSFAFSAKDDVTPGATVDSEPVTITGLSGAAAVSITGGLYAINGGAFTSANGTIENQQSIVVRVTASNDTFAPATATVTIGGVIGSFTATTLPDTEPASFSFAGSLGAALSASVDSPAAEISGIDVPVPISITGGEYAVDGGGFTAAEGTIADGQSLVVRVVAAGTFSTSTSATVTVGGVAATFTVTTVPDTIPDAFSFVDAIDVALSAQVDSAPVVIAGIEAPAPVSISGGSYAIDGGAFTSVAGLVDNGQAIVVRVAAAATPSTTVDATLTIGGVSDTFSATTIPDITPPTATISFPPLTSRTSADTIRFRGRSQDDMSTVVAVRVNGALATTTDGFATWSAPVPLVPNTNVVTIETEDSEGNVDATAVQATVRRRLRFGDVEGIALGATLGTILAVDSAARALTSVDLVNDERQIVSDNAAGGPDYAFLIPRTVVLDPADPDGRAFVLDPSMQAILSVDLATGARTIFSNTTIPSPNSPFVSASDMALDAAGNRLLVLDAVAPSIIAVDVATGERTVLSDAASAGPMFSGLGRIAVDAVYGVALVADFDPPYRIIAVPLAGGARSILSDQFTPNANNPLTFPAAIAVDAEYSRALVAQPETDSILAVDLATGERSIFTSSTFPDAVDPLGDVAALAVDTTNGRLVAVEADGQRRIFGISLLGGERTILSSDEPAGAANPFVEPKGIMLDAANGRALVTDPARAAVIALDLATAERSVFSDANVPNAANAFSWPGEIVPDPAANRAFVLDEYRPGVDEAEIIAIDLGSGARTIVTSDVFPNTTDPLTNPSNIALDAARNRLLVSDLAAVAVLAVDIGLGTRKILSSNTVPDTDNPYTAPRGIVIDEARNRGLIVNSTNSFASQLLELDVVSGERSIFSDINTPDGQNPFSGPTSVALDAGNDRLFLVDRQQSQIATVNLATAARSIVSFNYAPFPENPFGGPEGIAYDAPNQILYVVNQWFDGVLAVDTTTGHRVYVMP